MRKSSGIIALVAALLGLPAAAQEQPQFEPLLASFQATTSVSTYYSFCKPKDIPLSDEQIINLATNNVLLRSLVSGYLQGQHRDVAQPRMVAFIKSAALGIQLDVSNGLKQQGCDGEIGRMAHKQLPQAAIANLKENQQSDGVKLTLEQAGTFLDSLALK